MNITQLGRMAYPYQLVHSNRPQQSATLIAYIHRHIIDHTAQIVVKIGLKSNRTVRSTTDQAHMAYLEVDTLAMQLGQTPCDVLVTRPAPAARVGHAYLEALDTYVLPAYQHFQVNEVLKQTYGGLGRCDRVYCIAPGP